MLKVVVIDGNAISRNLLTTLLVNGQFEIVGDANASAAGIAAMIKLQPQIVCVDIGEADADGWQRLEHLRQALPKAVLLMVSANLDTSTIERASALGVQGFIVKPFKEATVLALIRKVIMKLAKQHQAVEQKPT